MRMHTFWILDKHRVGSTIIREILLLYLSYWKQLSSNIRPLVFFPHMLNFKSEQKGYVNLMINYAAHICLNSPFQLFSYQPKHDIGHLKKYYEKHV